MQSLRETFYDCGSRKLIDGNREWLRPLSTVGLPCKTEDILNRVRKSESKKILIPWQFFSLEHLFKHLKHLRVQKVINVVRTLIQIQSRLDILLSIFFNILKYYLFIYFFFNIILYALNTKRNYFYYTNNETLTFRTNVQTVILLKVRWQIDSSLSLVGACPRAVPQVEHSRDHDASRPRTRQ